MTHKRVTVSAVLICVGGIAVARAIEPVPPRSTNLCEIFTEKPNWYQQATRVYQRWGIPVPVQMAILRQESSFISDARPPREWLLGFIPLPRPSSAYGYAQALDSSWDLYRIKVNRRDADRENFADAVDFVGWYCDVTHRTLDIAKGDAKRLYLAYHEGQEGFRQGSYEQKPWLMPVAQKVAYNARRYRDQLKGCEKALSTQR